MADPKSIHEFLPTSGNIGSLFLVDDPDSQATSGYTTRNISMDDVGEMVNNGIDYTQDLFTENKKVIGGINELHGVDGYDVYDNTATYAVGDVCIHSNSLQVCTTAVTVAEDFDSNKWSPTTIKALLALKQNRTDNSLDTTNKTVVGSINELNTNKQKNLSFGSLTTTDLDTLRTNGFYYLSGVSSTYHAPCSYGVLEVIATSITLQRVTQVGSTGTSATQFERLYINGAWTTWRTITRT